LAVSAGDEELEALVDRGPPIRRARQRGDFERVVDDEGRLREIGLGRVLEQRQLQAVDAGVGGRFGAQAGQLRAQPGRIRKVYR